MSQSDFVSRGQALVAAGQFQEAVKVCRLGLLGRPTTVEGRVVLGQALLALKRYDEVLAEMRVALELDHSSVPAQVLKGEALLRKGDTSAAIETLHKARQAAPGDARILQLLAQCEQASMKGSMSASHPAVAFVGSGDTKHYPQHNEQHGDEDSGGGYTRPTSLSAPGALRRSSQRAAAAEPPGTPSPEQLAVGDKSGTVEVDPELDGIEMPDDLDFDDLAQPPPAAGKRNKIGGARGAVQSSKPSKKAKSGKTPKPRKTKIGVTPTPTPTIDLDEDAIELQETHLPRASRSSEPMGRPSRPGGTALRNAIAMPSGPLDTQGPQRERPKTLPPPNRDKPATVPPPFVAPPPPAAMQVTQIPPTPAPLPPAPGIQGMAPGLGPSGVPRLGAALPTVAAMQPPPPPVPPQNPASVAAAARPTLAIQAPIPPLSAAQQQSAAAVDALFGVHHAAAMEPTARPGEMLDPNIQAMVAGQPPPPNLAAQMAGAAAMVDLPIVPRESMRTGMRRGRSKAQVALWIFIGAIVIGGGVFAGFQIRAMRLQKQIAAARGRATDLAKADTWVGWTAAFTSLAEIANASGTLENRAALARARAQIAFEFNDGVPDAKTAVEALGGQGGLDASLASAYLALAQNDAKAAKLASDAALNVASQDPAAAYVAGQAALVTGDPATAIKYLKFAYEKEPRPFYGLALARAHEAAYAWDEAATTIDKLLATSPDHPAALIERARVYTAAGRVTGGQVGMELKAQLDKLIAEGAQPLAKQPRGVAPGQVAEALLALARVDFARNDGASARGDLRQATSNGVDDQRFAEDWVDTLYSLGDYAAAKAAVDRVLQMWPTSRRGRIELARILLATGKPDEADAALAKQADVLALPVALALRGQIRASVGNIDEARGDFEAALKKVPSLEPALVGRAWLHIAAGEIDEAKKLIEPHVGQMGTPPAVAVVYAAILRRSDDAGARDKAKAMLERVVAGAPGPETARAQLELARTYVAMSDFRGASAAYAEAIKGESFEAKLESALLLIEDSDAKGGRETLEAMFKAEGDHPRADVALELARARMLVGANDEAKQILDQADKLPNIVKWKLDREKGRLAMRKGDFAGAATALSRALDGSGTDAETLLLAADTFTSGDKEAASLGDKVKKLAPDRLKGTPEEKVVVGKLAIAAEKYADALAAYEAAKTALDTPPASARRRAQARFGMGVAKLFSGDDVAAERDLQLAATLDPSLYAADLFRASVLQKKNPKEAFSLAKTATTLDPDFVDGWLLAGQLAAKQGDKKFLASAIARLSTIAPTSEALKQLQALRR